MMYSSAHFEVYGQVQGVFFRAHTEDKAKQLGLHGYVANSPNGTVVGIIQGTPEHIEQMKAWLTEQGSPASRIEKCTFSNEKTDLKEFEFDSFQIRRGRHDH